MPSPAEKRAKKAHYVRNSKKLCKYARDYRSSNPENTAKINKRWRAKNPESFMLSTAKYRAKKRNLEFNLTLIKLKELLKPMICSVTSIKLSWKEVEYRNPYRPSIDRIDSSKGYTEDNIQIVAWIYNNLKQDLPSHIANKIILEMANGLR